MAELADAHGSGPCEGNFMEVRILLSAPIKTQSFCSEFFYMGQQLQAKRGSVKNVGVEDTPRISEPLSFFEKTLFSSAPTGVSHR